MKKIILGNTPINSGNRGCVALAYSVIYLIDHILDHEIYKIYMTDAFEPHGIHQISIGDKNIIYESIEKPSWFSIKGFVKSFLKMKQIYYSARIFQSADVIFDIGQGDSFADIYGKERFNTIDYIHKTARLFHKPYIFLPQTIGPFSDKKIRVKAVRSICGSEHVMTRDKESVDYVRQIAPKQQNVQEYIDVAFFLPYTKKSFDRTKVHVGLNISALLWNGGYTKNNQFGLRCDYQKTIRDVINYFLSLDNVVLHLIPHVVEQERSVENDYAVSFDLYEEYKSKNLVLAPFFLSPVDAKSYISGLDFFMGARMHATIAAFSSGVPVVPMAYSRKFNGLFIDTLGYKYMVDMKKNTDVEIISTIQNVYSQRQSIYDLIQNINAGVVSERKKALIESLENVLLER